MVGSATRSSDQLEFSGNQILSDFFQSLVNKKQPPKKILVE
jgi:hypothetical protein